MSANYINAIHLGTGPGDPSIGTVHHNRQDGLEQLVSARPEALSALQQTGEALVKKLEHAALSIYGAERLHSDFCLDSGTHRKGDFIVELEILARLEKRDAEGRKLRLLEVGAGATFPQNDFVGAPWLSRMLVGAFKDEIDIRATTMSNCLSLFHVGEEGTLRMTKVKVDNRVHGALVTPPAFSGSSADLKFPSLSASEVDAILKPHKKVSDMNFYRERFFERYPNDRWYLRPECDPAVEQAVFGLQTDYSVDLFSIVDSYRGQPAFDVLFGRFLYPPKEGEIDRAVASGREALAEEGYGYLHFDKGKRWGVALPIQFGKAVMSAKK